MTERSQEAPPSLPFVRIGVPFIFWILLIFALSAYPKALIPQGKYISWDKLAHIFAYAVLGYLTARLIFFSGKRWWYKHWALMTILFSLLYAASDEYHQYFVPGRYSSVYDVVADAIGVVLGYWLFRKSIKRFLLTN